MVSALNITDESESQTNSTTWVDKINVSSTANDGNIQTGRYKIFVTCEITGTMSNYGVACRVLLDGVERNFDAFVPWRGGQYKTSTFIGFIRLDQNEVHSIILQYAVENAVQTGYIRRARIIIEKE
jgi:hypothetical protein